MQSLNRTSNGYQPRGARSAWSRRSFFLHAIDRTNKKNRTSNITNHSQGGVWIHDGDIVYAAVRKVAKANNENKLKFLSTRTPSNIDLTKQLKRKTLGRLTLGRPENQAVPSWNRAMHGRRTQPKGSGGSLWDRDMHGRQRNHGTHGHMESHSRRKNPGGQELNCWTSRLLDWLQFFWTFIL
jgi:hypothetical protein